MITVIENKDFVECVFKTKAEADEYYSNHPSRETCRIIELEAKRFPVFVTEIGYGNFRYFPTKKLLIDLLRDLDMETLPKSKSVYSYIYDSGDCRTEEKIEPSINLYCYGEPFRGEEMDYDYMGMMDHEHLNPNWIDRIIQSNSLRCVGMERILLRKLAVNAAEFFSRFKVRRVSY